MRQKGTNESETGKDNDQSQPIVIDDRGVQASNAPGQKESKAEREHEADQTERKTAL